MNTLSWFLYLIDVIGNLSTLLGFVLMAGLICVIFATIMGSVVSDGEIWTTEEWLPYRKWYKRLWIVLIVCSIISVLIPERRTFYMIAASEAGEVVVKSPEAQEMMNLIRDRLRDILAPKKSE